MSTHTFRDLLSFPAYAAQGDTELLMAQYMEHHHLLWANGDQVVNPYRERGTLAEVFMARNVWQRVGLFVFADLGGYRHGARWFCVTLDGIPVFFGVQGEEGKREEYSHLYFPQTNTMRMLYRDLCGVISAEPVGQLEPWLPDTDPKSLSIVQWDDPLPENFLRTPIHDPWDHQDRLDFPVNLFPPAGSIVQRVPFSAPLFPTVPMDRRWLDADIKGCDVVIESFFAQQTHPTRLLYAYRKLRHTRALRALEWAVAKENVQFCELNLSRAEAQLALLPAVETPAEALRADIVSMKEILARLPAEANERFELEHCVRAQVAQLSGG